MSGIKDIKLHSSEREFLKRVAVASKKNCKAIMAQKTYNSIVT